MSPRKKAKSTGFKTFGDPKPKKKKISQKESFLRGEALVREQHRAQQKAETKYKRENKSISHSVGIPCREYIDLLTPKWCLYCIHAQNALDLNLYYSTCYNLSYFKCSLDVEFDSSTPDKRTIYPPWIYSNKTVHPFWDICDKFDGIEGVLDAIYQKYYPDKKREEKDVFSKILDMGENYTNNPDYYEVIENVRRTD